MRIDVVLPTYNRAALVPRAIGTFLAARVPNGVEARLLVVDNNSADETGRICAEHIARHPERIIYLFEARQGRHHALNAGIMASSAEIVAFFDDDETLDAAWLEVIAREFREPGTEFIGGAYVANWQAPIPSWLPPRYDGVLGISLWGEQRQRYGAEGVAVEMWGGNCAFRRRVFDAVGLYATEYMFGEDAEMFARIRGRLTGYYVPDLVIHHDIPKRKLTKSYFRQWFFDNGVNTAKRETAEGKRDRVRTLFGVPTWTLRRRCRLYLTSLVRSLCFDEIGALSERLMASWFAGYGAAYRRQDFANHADRSGNRAA